MIIRAWARFSSFLERYIWASHFQAGKSNSSAFVVALAECSTHAFLAAEGGSYATGEKTLASRLYSRGCAPINC
jgi:hypothetical protein